MIRTDEHPSFGGVGHFKTLVALARARHHAKSRTHVIVGDHAPEPRVEDPEEPRARHPKFGDFVPGEFVMFCASDKPCWADHCNGFVATLAKRDGRIPA